MYIASRAFSVIRMRFVIIFGLFAAVIGYTTSAAVNSLDSIVDKNFGALTLNSIEGRITNGQIALRNQFPYQAGLRIPVGGGGVWCGASILNNRYIITAAHCAEEVTIGLDVYLGAWDITDFDDRKMQVIFVPPKYVKIHEDWDRFTLNSDIALVKLPVIIYFNDYIQPVTLPALGSNDEYVGQNAIASGWGLISDTANAVTDKLRFIEVQILERANCTLQYEGFVTDSMICIRTGSEHTSTCSGDSGGPLVSADGSRTLIGLTSFGSSEGCEQGYPGVFTRITSFNEWIRKITGIQT